MAQEAVRNNKLTVVEKIPSETKLFWPGHEASHQRQVGDVDEARELLLCMRLWIRVRMTNVVRTGRGWGLTEIYMPTELHVAQLHRPTGRQNTLCVRTVDDRAQGRPVTKRLAAWMSLQGSATPWLWPHAAGEGQHGTYERRQAKVKVRFRSSQPTKSPTTTRRWPPRTANWLTTCARWAPCTTPEWSWFLFQAHCCVQTLLCALTVIRNWVLWPSSLAQEKQPRVTLPSFHFFRFSFFFFFRFFFSFFFFFFLFSFLLVPCSLFLVFFFLFPFPPMYSCLPVWPVCLGNLSGWDLRTACGDARCLAISWTLNPKKPEKPQNTKQPKILTATVAKVVRSSLPNNSLPALPPMLLPRLVDCPIPKVSIRYQPSVPLPFFCGCFHLHVEAHFFHLSLFLLGRCRYAGRHRGWPAGSSPFAFWVLVFVCSGYRRFLFLRNFVVWRREASKPSFKKPIVCLFDGKSHRKNICNETTGLPTLHIDTKSVHHSLMFFKSQVFFQVFSPREWWASRRSLFFE